MAKGKSDKTTEGKTFVVAEAFRDATHPSEYIIFEKGAVADFEGERLEELIKKGFVKEAE